MATSMRIVESDESHKYRDILGVICLLAEVLVDSIHTTEESLHILKSIVKGEWKHTNGRADTISSTDPFPEAKDVFIRDSKFFS